MNNTILFLACTIGVAIGVFGWLMAVKFYRANDKKLSQEEVLSDIKHITVLKLILVAVLGVILVGLAFVLNDISNDLHNQKFDNDSSLMVNS